MGDAERWRAEPLLSLKAGRAEDSMIRQDIGEKQERRGPDPEPRLFISIPVYMQMEGICTVIAPAVKPGTLVIE